MKQEFGFMYGQFEPEEKLYDPNKKSEYTVLTKDEPSAEEANEVNQGFVNRQHKMDSFMEAASNTAVGFLISWAVWVWVVAPLFGFHNGAATSFLVTCIFTVTSLARQYILRRLFDGKTIWEAIRGKFIR